MNKTTQVFLAAVAAFAAAACFAEEIGGAVLPMSAPLLDGDAKAIAQKLKAIRDRGGISRFALASPGHSVRINGMMGVDAYRKIGRNLRAVREAVAADGIEVGYMMLPTMNCGINHPWQKYTREDGSVREFTACFGEEGFRRDFAEKCAAVDAEAKPPFHMFGDDFRYWGFGCFCEGHLRRFAELTGVTRDRTTLMKGLKRRDRRGDELRMAWHLFQFEDLKRMAEATVAAVAQASPETRLVYCAPGRFPERESATMATILAGKHRPAIRWWGAVYGHDFPVEASGLLFCAQWSRENLSPDMETLYEADPCPHSRFYASASRMGALISATTAMGYAEPLFDALSGRADALATSPDYLDMYKRDGARFAAVKREAATGRIVGVQAAFNPYVRIGGKWDAKHPLDEKAWYRTLNRLGIPVTTAEAPVKLFAGHHAFRYMDGAAITNLLSGGAFLDGAAAEALTEMGFADLIGVKATARDKIDFAGERLVTAGEPTTFPCAFHQNYGLDGCAVSRLSPNGAENLAVFSSKNGDQPSMTCFENSLGGKVAVMAVNLAGCKSPNVFSFAKRDFLVKVFRRLGGERAVPVRVIDRANVMLLANDDGKRLFLHATNLSCDPADSFVFEVTAPYAGGKVEILDGAEWVAADAAWDGGRVTVHTTAPVNVYGTLVLRIRSAVALHGGVACGGDFTIARRGAPADCTVVVSAKAAPAVRFAAKELCDYVKRMTGVALAQSTDEKPLFGKAVLIGQTRWSDELAGNGIGDLGDEGFRIAVKGDRLHILGSDARGTLYGVYELLERFGGCGWFSPDCEVVPETEAFAVTDGFDVTQKPAFRLRTTDWGIVGKNPEFAVHLRINGETKPVISKECGGAALRFCNGLGMGHTFQHLLPSEVWFESHPEYFCEVDGRRRSGKEIQPCLSNPDVLRIVVSNVLERLAADPEANIVGVSQNDNRMYCRCEKCRAVDEEEGGPTGSLLRFVNAVAEEVEKVRPDVLVQTLIFQYSRKPPKVAHPRRNVMPCLCAIEIGHAVPFAERAFKADSLYMDDLEQWGRISDHLLIWDYSTNYHNFLYSFPAEHTFAPNLRTYLANGVKYMFMEGATTFHCDFEELKAWLLAKLMWNPEQDEKALLDRFFAGYYGAAAPFVREYFERLKKEAIAHPKERLGIFDANPPSWYTADLSSWAKALFAKAEEAVRDDPVRYRNVRYSGLVPVVTEMDRYAAGAKCFFVSRNPGSCVAPKELRDDWRRVIETMASTKKDGHAMRLAAGLCWEPCKLADWKLVYGRTDEPQPCDKAIIPPKDLFIVSGRHAKLFDDGECARGKALTFLPSSGKPMARLEFSKVAFDDGVPYKVRFRAKVVRDGGRGAAFRATLAEKGAKPVAITNLGEAQTLGKGGEAIERNVDEVGDGYAWYEFRPTVLNDKLVFEFGSGPWERGGGIGATKEVRLAAVEISRCD